MSETYIDLNHLVVARAVKMNECWFWFLFPILLCPGFYVSRVVTGVTSIDR
jgi:hypothetical protein